jgi:ABC-type transporter Mla subunit MlaD
MKASGFVVGLAVGTILAGAVLFSIYYVPRKGLSLSRQPLRFTVVLAEAHGLHAGSPVLVSGVEAGEVADVRIQALDGVGHRVLATAEVFDGDRFGPMLTTKSRYAVARSGLLGEMTLAITPGGEGPPLGPGALVDGEGPLNLEAITQDLAHLTGRLADFMDGRQPGDPSLKRTLRDLQAMLRNLRETSEKLPH